MSAMAAPHPLNRNLFIADNLSLLRRLDNESIDLVCIDPPFAKNETWKGALKPPLTRAELDNERAMLAGWGLRNAVDAEAAGVVWPDGADAAGALAQPLPSFPRRQELCDIGPLRVGATFR